MHASNLDNPIWHSLNSRHRAFAIRWGNVARYPAPIAPFLGVRIGDMNVSAELDALIAADEQVYLLGHVPSVPLGWRLEALGLLLQMVCPDPVEEIGGPEIAVLSDLHCKDVLALTALVYPHYFRERTMELGRYFGIYRDGRLAAMIGERMGTDDWQEISAVCTHPDFTGHGYARHLLTWLSNDVLAQGRTPFLHVSESNERAIQLYLQNGYNIRCEIPFWALSRAVDRRN